MVRVDRMSGLLLSRSSGDARGCHHRSARTGPVLSADAEPASRRPCESRSRHVLLEAVRHPATDLATRIDDAEEGSRGVDA
jgi:hypothetical protein